MSDPAPQLFLAPDLPLTLHEAGRGRPVLVLHGGGGPATVAPLAGHLSAQFHTLMPTHPGWNGTPRLDGRDGIAALARLYLEVLATRELRDVVVIGSSLGGWIGAEMALADREGRLSGLVLINAVGAQVEGESVRDVFELTPHELAGLSWHDPERFLASAPQMTPERVAQQQGNLAAMRALLGGPGMEDPALLPRLAGVRVPTLVLWGESDRVVTPQYGAAYAAAFANARFMVIPGAGHLPHLEQPGTTFAQIDAFLRG